MSDLFVSYSRNDRAFVANIVDALRAAGENVWVDLEGIEPSTVWMDEIRSAIAASDVLVFFLSPASAASEVCRAELDYAVQLQKRIVPVALAETPHSLVPAPLPDINWHFVRPESFDSDVGRLVEILNLDIARVHQHTRLLLRATEWDTRGDRSLLLRGTQLAEAEIWLTGQRDEKPTTTPVQARFIAASRRATTRRQRGWFVTAAVIVTIFAVMTAVALIQWRVATQQRNVATSRQLAAQATTALAADPQLSLILALHAYSASPTSAAQDAVRAAVRQSTVRAILPAAATPHGDSGYVAVGGQSFDRSGTFVVFSSGHAVAVWEWEQSVPDSPTTPTVLDVPTDLGDVVQAQFGSGDRIVFATRAGGVFEWDWTAGSNLEAVHRLVLVDRNPQLGPGGSSVVTVGGDGSVSVTDIGANRRPTRFVADKPVQHVALSRDGRLLAVSTQGDVIVWSIDTGDRVFSAPLQFGGALGFSPDRRLLAVAQGAAIKVFDLGQPADVRTLVVETPADLPAHCCDVNQPLALVWSPDGAALAAATSDRSIRVWVGGASTPTYLNGDTYSAGGVSFSPDGRFLLSGGAGPEVWEWQAASPVRYSGHFSPPVMSPDGAVIAAADDAGNAMLLGAQRWSTRRLAPGIPLAFSPDGRYLALEDAEAIGIWEVESVRRVAQLSVSTDFGTIPGYVMPQFRARFDSTGRRIALLDTTERPAKLLHWQWDSSPSAQVLAGDHSDAGVQALLGWGPENAIHYISEDRLESWDAHGPPQVLAALPRRAGDTFQAEYLAPGKVLLVLGVTQLWDLGTDTVTELLPEHPSTAFALSGDRNALAISADDGYVHMWDLRPADSAIEIGRYDVAPHLAANRTGSRLAIVDFPELRVVPTTFAAPFADVLALARDRVVRSLSDEERATYLPS